VEYQQEKAFINNEMMKKSKILIVCSAGGVPTRKTFIREIEMRKKIKDANIGAKNHITQEEQGAGGRKRGQNPA
jgi:hypothetical protein